MMCIFLSFNILVYTLYILKHFLCLANGMWVFLALSLYFLAVTVTVQWVIGRSVYVVAVSYSNHVDLRLVSTWPQHCTLSLLLNITE